MTEYIENYFDTKIDILLNKFTKLISFTLQDILIL